MKTILLSLSLVISSAPMAAARDLSDRFERLSCAVAHYQADGSSGTGAFIDADGHFLTAAHVALDRSYMYVDPSNTKETIKLKDNSKILRGDGTTVAIPKQEFKQSDLDNAATDLALISTGVKTNCFLKIGDPKKAKVGQSFIAIGYPASSPTGVLYDGFLSAVHTAVHVLGPISNMPGKNMPAQYDVMRVQMPISPGASGAPLINEQDEVVAVIVEVPVPAIDDIQKLIQVYTRNQPRSSVAIIGGFETNKVLAELAFIVQEFESPGSGQAVPLSYLHRE